MTYPCKYNGQLVYPTGRWRPVIDNETRLINTFPEPPDPLAYYDMEREVSRSPQLTNTFWVPAKDLNASTIAMHSSDPGTTPLITHQHWFFPGNNQRLLDSYVLDGDRRIPITVREVSFFPSLVITTLLFARGWRFYGSTLFFSTTEGLLLPCAGEVVASEHPSDDFSTVTMQIRPDSYIRDDDGNAFGVSAPLSEQHRRSSSPRFDEELPWRSPEYVDVTSMSDSVIRSVPIRTYDPSPHTTHSRSRSTDRPKVCEGCRNYFGETHGGNRVICGIHPFGAEGDRCGDWEGAVAR